MSFQHLADSHLSRSALLKPAWYCLLDGRVHSTHACPSDYVDRKGPSLPDGGALPAGSFSPCPNWRFLLESPEVLQ